MNSQLLVKLLLAGTVFIITETIYIAINHYFLLPNSQINSIIND